jgi:hypothetical protein
VCFANWVSFFFPLRIQGDHSCSLSRDGLLSVYWKSISFLVNCTTTSTTFWVLPEFFSCQTQGPSSVAVLTFPVTLLVLWFGSWISDLTYLDLGLRSNISSWLRSCTFISAQGKNSPPCLSGLRTCLLLLTCNHFSIIWIPTAFSSSPNAIFEELKLSSRYHLCHSYWVTKCQLLPFPIGAYWDL